MTNTDSDLLKFVLSKLYIEREHGHSRISIDPIEIEDCGVAAAQWERDRSSHGDDGHGVLLESLISAYNAEQKESGG